MIGSFSVLNDMATANLPITFAIIALFTIGMNYGTYSFFPYGPYGGQKNRTFGSNVSCDQEMWFFVIYSVNLFQTIVVIDSRAYVLELKSDAPAVRGSTVHFTADLYESNGSRVKISDITYKWVSRFNSSESQCQFHRLYWEQFFFLVNSFY